MTPKQELKLIADRLNAAHKGIIPFQDTEPQTAAMLPAFCGIFATTAIMSYM